MQVQNFLIQSLVVGLCMITSWSVNAQPYRLQDLIADNHELLNRTQVLMTKVETSKARNEVSKESANRVYKNLQLINKRGQERRAFYYELKHIQKSLMPMVLRTNKLKNSCDRMSLENYTLRQDKMYSRALTTCLVRPEKFVKSKKVYFKKGKFSIPKKYWPQAKKLYKPIIDSILKIGQQYPDQKFEVRIITQAFSDRSNKLENPKLLAEMQARLQSEKLTNDEINLYLSNLRAYALYQILYDVYRDNKKKIKKMRNLDFKFSQEGMSTKKPNAYVNYGKTDRRLRVARVQWHILPKF